MLLRIVERRLRLSNSNNNNTINSNRRTRVRMVEDQGLAGQERRLIRLIEGRIWGICLSLCSRTTIIMPINPNNNSNNNLRNRSNSRSMEEEEGHHRGIRLHHRNKRCLRHFMARV
jgi:hypothetical protein